jgi:hypothetical protein
MHWSIDLEEDLLWPLDCSFNKCTGALTLKKTYCGWILVGWWEKSDGQFTCHMVAASIHTVPEYT